jgi:flagellar protein FliO/FliZ
MSAAAQASPITAGSIAQLGLSLALIIALIFGVSWLLRRMRLGGSVRNGSLAVLGELSVGPRDRILLLGVGDAQVLVGITPAGMVALQPLAAPITLQPAPPAPVFAAKLRELMQRQGGER